VDCWLPLWQEEPDNKDLAAELKKAEAIKAKIEQKEREKREAEEKRQAEDNKILALLGKRGIQMGAPSFNTQVPIPSHPSPPLVCFLWWPTYTRGPVACNVQAYLSQQGSIQGGLSGTVFVGPSGDVSMSVLFIYEEYKQTDFVKEFNLEETFIDHLAMMFPSLIYTPVAESGESISITPPSWDEKKDYLVENLQVYYETNWTQPLSSSKKKSDKKQQQGKTKVKVDPRWTLERVLRDPRYVIPGLPVFYIVPARAEATFLRVDLDEPRQS
jgi:hypothetical protein